MIDKKNFLDILKKRVLIMDGATGTELQSKNYLNEVTIPEELNIKFPKRISDIYRSYINSGSDVILSNTFGANYIRLKHYGLLNEASNIVCAGIELARNISKDIIVAGDISPIGEYIEPLGKKSFDEVYDAYAFQASLLQKHGADIIVIETMTEIKELKAAILATKENFEGAIISQMTFSKDGISVTGTDLSSFISIVESLKVDVLGLNCSIGSQDLVKLIKFLCCNTNLPISFKPNAGIPTLVNHKTFFPETKKEFIKSSLDAYSCGVNMFGGCCGTTPDFIKSLANELRFKPPVKRKIVNKNFFSSRTKAIDINDIKKPIFIGERINPTNRKQVQKELLSGNLITIKNEAKLQVDFGSKFIDINISVPGINEKKLLTDSINQIQEIVDVPLCIDSSDFYAIEEAVKNCAGRPIINSVNGEQKKLNSILPIVKRFGSGIIALTTDDNGIPKTAKDRLNIAEKILNNALKFGIDLKNIIFDYLVLSVSSSQNQIIETLKAMKESKIRYPDCKLVLGISNVSFGLPSRQTINSTFLKIAVDYGLDFAIVNPHENWSIDDKIARNLLNNNSVSEYISKFSSFKNHKLKNDNKTSFVSLDKKLYFAIIDGDQNSIPSILDDIIVKFGDNTNCFFKSMNDNILNALNIVGKKFLLKEYFLPQIIMSAQSAQLAFSIIKSFLKKDNVTSSYGKIIMATVKGDMHDIGKNIVSTVLESYGFDVIDMGINVDSESIISKALEIKPVAIGLSALMTTTMQEMETVIKLKNLNCSYIKIIIGGAAVTKKFAKEIKADAYANNAMEAAVCMKKFVEKLI
jgi:5-methyltetrahydrofolate--homocysteine methyltransferase